MNKPPEAWEARVRDLARHFPYPPTPNLAARWRSPHQKSVRHLSLRWAMALCLLIFAVGALAIPPVRAGIADFFQVGSVRIWRIPPKATLPPATDEPLGEAVTLAEAQAEVWYPILLPTYPSGIGDPDVIWLLAPEEDGIQLVWYGNDHHPELRLTQFGAGFWVHKWGPALEGETPATTVNGRYAAWVPGPHTWRFIGPQGERFVTVPQGSTVLIWSTGEITYRLESTLPQAEAVQIAESLK